MSGSDRLTHRQYDRECNARHAHDVHSARHVRAPYRGRGHGLYIYIRKHIVNVFIRGKANTKLDMRFKKVLDITIMEK